MSKSADAFRTISEVADWLDTPAHVLRFWESKFSQIKPVKRAGGRRYYRPADMMLVGGIKKLLHDDGLTIKGAQKILREQGVKHVAALSIAVDDESDVVTVEGTEATENLAQPTTETDAEPDLDNVSIEVPLVPDEPEANVLQFQRDEPSAPEPEICIPDAQMDKAPVDMIPESVAEAVPEPKTEVVVETETVEPTPESESFLPPSETSDAAQLNTPAAPEQIEDPAVQDVNQLTDPMPDFQRDLQPEKTQEPQPDKFVQESENTMETGAQPSDAPNETPNEELETQPETVPDAAPESAPVSEIPRETTIAPEITTEEEPEEAEVEPSFPFSFQHRSAPEIAPEVPPQIPESPQDAEQTETNSIDGLSKSPDLLPSEAEAEPTLEVSPQPEASLEETVEEEMPSRPRPNVISLPDDPADDMAEGAANGAATARVLAILAQKSDGLDTTQAAELTPLLDRLGALQNKMLAQRKD